MSEEAFVNDPSSSVRPRRACINCFEKKIKCDYDPGLGVCNPCSKSGLECSIPVGDVPKARKSIRATVDDLESRVQFLEGHQGPWNAASNKPQSAFHTLTPASLRAQPGSNESIVDSASSSNVVSIPLTRGYTSPWSVLLSGTDGGTELQSFHASAAVSADSETSITISENAILYDMFNEVPGLSLSKIHDCTRNYAIIAPYPILYWKSLQQTIETLVERKQMKRIGQVTCVWVYMAFGAAHRRETAADTIATNEPGLYFQKAWGLLPQLLLEYDIWALKAVTLMVHYLQAGAKPQACWALLGTALRLAVSLGFDRNNTNLSYYSKVELEEGRRAFWLCYIMEKSLCINLGHSSSFTGTPKVPVPVPFLAETVNEEDDDVFGNNEHDAADFFREMIELTEVRDGMFAGLQSGRKMPDDAYQHLLLELKTTPKIGSSELDWTTNIRNCIHSLAHNNTLQILTTTQTRATGERITSSAIISARRSLDLISESQKSGQLMCLWMWLYYAFTSAVILFLDSIANPLDPETTLNLAAISDLEKICSDLADTSEGAGRCREIAMAMRAVILKTVKVTGRKRDRDVEGEKEDEAAAEGPSRSRRRIQSENAVSPADLEETAPDAGRQNLAADSDAMLVGAPTNFAWDDWDKWLEDVDLTGGYGP